MATFTVSNLNDSGLGSLRQAIIDANNLAGADLIAFDSSLSGQAIKLTSEELMITDELTIDGDLNNDGIPDITVHRDVSAPDFRIIHISNATFDDTHNGQIDVEINGLIISGGQADSSGGGGIRSEENLTVKNSTISGNSATGEESNGGGIYNSFGSLSLTNSTVTNNLTNGNLSLGGGVSNNGNELIVNNSTISGNSSNGTGSHGGGIYSHSGRLIVNSSTISGNAATGDRSNGGGIAKSYSYLQLINSTISGNSASGDGGGIASEYFFGVNIINSTITDNTAEVYGGGIYAYFDDVKVSNSTISNNSSGFRGGGIFAAFASLETINSTISGNTAIAEGGGIAAGFYSLIRLTSSTVSGNSTTGNSSPGGGIFIGSSYLQINQSVVSGNTTTGANSPGGGIFMSDVDTYSTITSSTISGNSTTGTNSHGGGIYSEGSDLAISYSTINGNSATGTSSSGGGLFVDTRFGGVESTIISNSTISGNSASLYGGGIYSGESLLEIRNSTVTSNTALGSLGSGVASNEGTEVVSSIIAGNTNSDVDSISGSSSAFISQGNNLIGTGNAVSAFDQPSDITGDTNPGLEPLADNGGPTQTHALQTDSPALNAGSNPDNLASDQRGPGFDRVVDGQADIGAFEATFGIVLETLINGFDADTAAAALEVNPGEILTWTYRVINTGSTAFAFDDVVLTADQGLTPVFDTSSDVGSDGILSKGETWIYTASSVAEDLRVSIDFETDANGDTLEAGDVITDQYSHVGLTISTPRNAFGAMIFDSANPTGGDFDLGTPNQDFGGPGRGEGGSADMYGENSLALDNILIISEDGDALDPDDNARGGQILFDWGDDLVRVHSVGVLDADSDESGGEIVTLSEQGNTLDSYEIYNLSNNSYQQIVVNDEPIAQLQVNLVSSGAVTGLSFTRYFSSLATVSAGELTASDASYYTNGPGQALTESSAIALIPVA